MHSTELSSAEFEIAIAGAEGTVEELFPGFNEQSRIGVVLCEDFAAVGASTLLMAAITAFYDIQRAKHPEGFYRYVDYYLFHVERMRGNHTMLDVSPDHKEVLVPTDTEEVLRAINDRGITHLLVPEGPPREASLEPQTLNSATARLKGALLYSPSGRVEDPDVEIAGCERVDHYVWATLNQREWFAGLLAEGFDDPKVIAELRARLDDVEDDVAKRIEAQRRSLESGGRTVETFRRIEVEQALQQLLPATRTIGAT